METIGLAQVAAVLAEPSRSAICLALLDGRAWTVGELARSCRIAPSTASEHVERLRSAGFVQTVRQGRHSYVRIADVRVAELVEKLAEHGRRQPVEGLRASLRARRLALARTCYDHLAGALGVALRDGMLACGLIDTSGGLALTEAGRQALGEIVIRWPAGAGRPILRDCLDWTERREHLGGAIPAALLERALTAGWLERAADRAVRVCPTAAEPFARLGVRLDQLGGHVDRLGLGVESSRVEPVSPAAGLCGLAVARGLPPEPAARRDRFGSIDAARPRP